MRKQARGKPNEQGSNSVRLQAPGRRKKQSNGQDQRPGKQRKLEHRQERRRGRSLKQTPEMKEELNEEFARFQKLAGLIK